MLVVLPAVAGTVVHMYADGTGEQTETMSVAVQSEGAVRQFSVVSNWYANSCSGLTLEP